MEIKKINSHFYWLRKPQNWGFLIKHQVFGQILLTIVIFYAMGTTLFAQKSALPVGRDSVIKTGMIRTQGNLSGGYLFQTKAFTSYISGNAEYYINENFSIVGEIWGSFDIINPDQIGLRKNFALFTGLNFHPIKKSRWDPYIGFSAGGGFITSNYYLDTVITESPVQFTPILGVTAGLNYYVGSIFHFFVQCKFVAGGNNSSQYGRTYLEELKFSGGLGWNLSPRMMKK